MAKPPFSELMSWTLGNIMTHIQFVKLGNKPVSEITIHNEFLGEVFKEIKKNKLNLICVAKGKTHTSVYIYKYSYLKHVINFSLGKSFNKKILKTWINGKMFGYSDSSINDYITKNYL